MRVQIDVHGAFRSCPCLSACLPKFSRGSGLSSVKEGGEFLLSPSACGRPGRGGQLVEDAGKAKDTRDAGLDAGGGVHGAG